MTFSKLFGSLIFTKLVFGLKNNKELSTFGFGIKAAGLISHILLILSFQLQIIDNLPYFVVLDSAIILSATYF